MWYLCIMHSILCVHNSDKGAGIGTAFCARQQSVVLHNDDLEAYSILTKLASSCLAGLN